jgi:outer membrane protein assembly factor BamE (lipoprotein component of BamABCDE complex)
MRRPAHFAAPVLAFAALAVAGLSACAPIASMNGFVAVDAKPQDTKVGEDTRSTVLAKLGSPSAVATFDPNVWYYISQTSEKVAYLRPQLKSRTVTVIAFDKGTEKVTTVKTLGLGDGYQVAYDTRETPTRGRQLSALEQLLGTIGRGAPIPQDNDPGQHPY